MLAILENHGIGDASDGFDSGSDQDAALCESNVSDSKDEPKEASMERNMEVRDNDGETYSSSEIDSSPSTGRSLSWKSDRESLHSSNRKKYSDSARRSSSFASTGTSSKHVGKSCRRIRRKETRLVSFFYSLFSHKYKVLTLNVINLYKCSILVQKAVELFVCIVLCFMLL